MRKLKRIWDVITTVLVGIVVVLAVLLVGARVIGLQVFTVLSGSMEPTYHTGSLIYVQEVDAFDLEAGQVITFMLNEDTVATHRIIEVAVDEEDPETIRYFTKGDANESRDSAPVLYENVIGTVKFSLPKLGYISNYFSSPSGRYAGMAIVFFLILL